MTVRTKEEKVSLSNLGDGVAVEMFDAELEQVLKDILDPNKKPKAKRVVNLKLTIAPDEERFVNDWDVQVTSSLAPARAFSGRVIVDRDRGRVEARELLTGQQNFVTGENVVPIEGREANDQGSD